VIINDDSKFLIHDDALSFSKLVIYADGFNSMSAYYVNEDVSLPLPDEHDCFNGDYC
jgi:hypothetical protein